MRINKPNNVFQVYNKNQGVKRPKSEKINKGEDQLKISDTAMDFQFALQKLKDVDDIRMEKVEGLKQQIKAGTYIVDGNKIAEKIMESVGFDKKI